MVPRVVPRKRYPRKPKAKKGAVNSWFTAEELAQAVRAFFYLSSQSSQNSSKPIGGEGMWEGVKRLTKSKRGVRALQCAVHRWRRANPWAWDAMKEAVNEDPDTYFAELVGSAPSISIPFYPTTLFQREADTKFQAKSSIDPDRLAMAVQYLAPRYPESPKLNNQLMFREAGRLLSYPHSAMALKEAFFVWRAVNAQRWEEMKEELRMNPYHYFDEIVGIGSGGEGMSG
jgi:hypothetical protein